jgi:hypothetical protein
VGASIDLQQIEAELEARSPAADGRVVLTDAGGRPIAGHASLPARDFAIPAPGTVAQLVDADGRRWSYAAAPVLVDGVEGPVMQILFAAPAPVRFDRSWWLGVSAISLPVLVVVLAVLAIWLGTNGAILRWIVRLRMLADAYAGGAYRTSLAPYRTAPLEFRALAASLGQMARTIDNRDRELRQAVEQQALLTRELHHRVRNNLQILASYLSLAERKAGADSGVEALAAARLRIGAIALMHRLLYDSGDLARLPAGQLLEELCRLMERHLGLALPLGLDCDSEGAVMDIDTAVPLALWAIEAVTALCADGSARQLALRLEADAPGQLRLRVAARGPHTGAVMPGQIMHAIARQLGASMEAGPGDSGEHSFSLLLPLDRRADKEKITPVEQPPSADVETASD